LATIQLAILSVVLAIVATILILTITAAVDTQSPIAGDPPIYDTLATEILDGKIPYVDTTVEHLPGALMLMVLIKGLSQITNVSFLALWPLAMAILFVASTVIVDRIPTSFDSGRRFLLLSLPLLPLVLFRIEPWLMVWVVASIGFAFRSAWRNSSLTAVAASLIKGWPIVLFALPLRSGQRRLAFWAGLGTVLALAFISVLPGFREGRVFEGIHTETAIGSLVLVGRGLAGAHPQLVGAAGAFYVAVGAWVPILNTLVGLPFILLGIRALKYRSKSAPLTRAIGLIVLGIILASPLFSAQFVFWLVPFAIFLGLRHRIIYLAASAMTLATAIWWDPSELLWSVLVSARNGLLIGLAVFWALSLRGVTDKQDSAVS
jgi:hypothetical protein